MVTSILNSPLFETIICLILAYALLSLLVSTFAEIVNSYFNERGRQLYANISRLFDDGLNVNFGQLMYNHPIIANMRKDLNHLPQYISNSTFSQALIDTVGNSARVYKYDEGRKAIIMEEHLADPFDRFAKGVINMAHTDLKLLLLNMVEKSIAASSNDTAQRLSHLDDQLQQWYKDQMDHATGWFKDLMRVRLRWIALLVALALNVNSIYLFKSVYTNPVLRGTLIPVAENLADNYARARTDTTLTAVQQAYQAVAASQLKKGSDSSLAVLHGLLNDMKAIDSMRQKQDTQRLANIQRARDELDMLVGLGIPIGWHTGIPPLSWNAGPLPLTQTPQQALNQTSIPIKGKPSPSPDVITWIGRIFWYIIGILITAFSISAGAPFWFDLLLKFVNIRRAGKKPDTN